MFYLCALCPRLLKGRPEFVFVPRSRQELPANFPEDIPGVCYFLETAFKTSKLTKKWSQTAAPKKRKKRRWEPYQVNTVLLPCMSSNGQMSNSRYSCPATKMSVCCQTSNFCTIIQVLVERDSLHLSSKIASSLVFEILQQAWKNNLFSLLAPTRAITNGQRKMLEQFYAF